MADIGLVSFAGVSDIEGAEMTFSRGVHPSCALIRSYPATTGLGSIRGTLTWTYGGNTVSFADAAVEEVIPRNFYGRDGYRFDLKVVDRRWKWRYPRVDGVYNERILGSIQSNTQKTAREIATILLDALGETGYDVSNVSDACYPPCFWNRARAALELEWLCDLLGLVVVLKLDNTVSLEPLNQGAALPAGALNTTPDDLPWSLGVLPATLRVQGDPTVYQSELTLTPVYLAEDGDLDNSSPGWSVDPDDWPELNSSISTTYRPLAHWTNRRWFKIEIPSSLLDGVAISDTRQIELLPYLDETATGWDLGDKILPPVVRGSYYNYGERAINTAANAVYTGQFKVHPERQVVEFEMPVFKIENGDVADPDLTIFIAYRLRKADGSGYATYTKDRALTVTGGSGVRVLNHPELTKHEIRDAYWKLPGNNETALDGEADEYLDAVDSTYTLGQAQAVEYDGILPQDLDGALSQIHWRAGKGLASRTILSRLTESDIYTMHHQQRRAMNRLAQMAERMSL